MASFKTNLAAGDLFLSEDPHGGVAARENKEGDPPGFHRRLYVLLHSRMEGGKSTVVNGLPTTGATLPQTKFCRTLLSCRTKNALVRICSALVSMIKILPNGVMPSCRTCDS
jgi:hypothetical protein